jgi:hypothetical protein
MGSNIVCGEGSIDGEVGIVGSRRSDDNEAMCLLRVGGQVGRWCPNVVFFRDDIGAFVVVISRIRAMNMSILFYCFKQNEACFVERII